jgi:hypothetical protein
MLYVINWLQLPAKIFKQKAPLQLQRGFEDFTQIIYLYTAVDIVLFFGCCTCIVFSILLFFAVLPFVLCTCASVGAITSETMLLSSAPGHPD